MAAEELMFTIDPSDKKLATALPATALAKMQYAERDLQEWVSGASAHPRRRCDCHRLRSRHVAEARPAPPLRTDWMSSAGI